MTGDLEGMPADECSAGWLTPKQIAAYGKTPVKESWPIISSLIRERNAAIDPPRVGRALITGGTDAAR